MLPVYNLEPSFWDKPYPASVYKTFASLKRACNSFAGEDDGSIELEVEGRLGISIERQRTQRFSPGCEEKFFNKVLNFYLKPLNPPPTSETYDVTFDASKLRVSVKVVNGELSVSEVIRKMRDEVKPIDAELKGELSHDLRISAMVERRINVEECPHECDIALRWVSHFLGKPMANPDFQRLEQLAKGFPHTLSNGRGSIVCGPTDINLNQSNIYWTLLNPKVLVDLYGATVPINFSLQLTPDSEVVVGNLPGKLVTIAGLTRPISAFEMHVKCCVRDLESTLPLEAVALPDDKVFVRHKIRWKINLPNTSLTLDLTKTRQGSDPAQLASSFIKNEMEIERCLSVMQGMMIDPAVETVALLKAISAILFKGKVDRPSANTVAAWANQTDHFMIDLNKLIASQKSLSRVADQQDSIPDGAKRARMGESATAEAESFYNDLSRQRDERHKSLIYHMRCLNNFVKTVLINKYLTQIQGGEARILELSCGKGGDLGKMQKAKVKISKYIGTDIALKSLEEAVNRLGNSGSDGRFKFVAADLTQTDLTKPDWGIEAGLMVWDGRDWRKSSAVMMKLEQVNFVSMQFALHYMFASYECASRFFKGVASRMETGARFVATTVSADGLLTALMESPTGNKISIEDERGREICSLEFDEDAYQRLMHKALGDREDWMGLKYRFKLFDAESANDRAVDAPEYVVARPALLKLAEANGLAIVEEGRLADFAMHELRGKGEELTKLWQRMNVSNQEGTLSDVEWKIAGLYQVIVFEKIAHHLPSEEANTMQTEDFSDDDAQLYVKAIMELSQSVFGWEDRSEDEKNNMIEKFVTEMRAI